MIPRGRIIGARWVYQGTFTLLSNALEQLVLQSTSSDYGGSGILQVEIDASAFVFNNTRLRLYHEFPGAIFAPFDAIVISASQAAVLFPLNGFVGRFRVTLQSQVAEAAARAVPYVFSIF